MESSFSLVLLALPHFTARRRLQEKGNSLISSVVDACVTVLLL